jgi:hypothetical protein
MCQASPFGTSCHVPALRPSTGHAPRPRLFGPPAAADRWRIEQLGYTVMSAAIRLREEAFPTVFLNTAA